MPEQAPWMDSCVSRKKEAKRRRDQVKNRGSLFVLPRPLFVPLLVGDAILARFSLSLLQRSYEEGDEQRA